LEQEIYNGRDGFFQMIPFSSKPEILSLLDNNVGVVLVFRDVIELIKTEQELLKVKKLESIGVPAGGIAHDFNNILAEILGNIQEVLSFDPDTKVVVAGGYSNDPVMASYQIYGFCAALVKPFQIQELA
jgi:hypothetical protein